jgi:hypothetical protein
MTNLIAKVAELKELDKIPEFAQNWEVEIDGRTFSDGSQVAHIKLPGKGKVMVAYTMPLDVANAIVNLRNAALGLLAALGKVQAGDAAEIAWIIKNYGFTLRDHIEVLHRYADLAHLMEGSP